MNSHRSLFSPSSVFHFISVFAFGTGYLALFLARSFQGVASSCIGITGNIHNL